MTYQLKTQQLMTCLCLSFDVPPMRCAMTLKWPVASWYQRPLEASRTPGRQSCSYSWTCRLSNITSIQLHTAAYCNSRHHKFVRHPKRNSHQHVGTCHVGAVMALKLRPLPRRACGCKRCVHAVTVAAEDRTILQPKTKNPPAGPTLPCHLKLV